MVDNVDHDIDSNNVENNIDNDNLTSSSYGQGLIREAETTGETNISPCLCSFHLSIDIYHVHILTYRYRCRCKHRLKYRGRDIVNS